MQIIIISTILSFAASLAAMIIFEVYKPVVKKHSPIIQRLISFALRYILPIAAIIILMVYSVGVTKYFVLGITLNVAAFLSNLIIDIARIVKEIDRAQNQSFDFHLLTINRIKDVMESQLKTQQNVGEVASMQKNLLNITLVVFQFYKELINELKRQKIKFEPLLDLKNSLEKLYQDLNSSDN